ncbi:MAG: type IV toxin-antitoxin system AbiEi family antitoxin domain-containing protein [Thermodesulfobacteriota bacterium]|nr:type IV toxin-antitoxin system AbiEi family antitoxin domain-containing protein [Thermodesulfobacteriota bacterium]
MQSKNTQKDRIIDLARKLGVVRVRDLSDRGLHHESLRRLCKDGVLVKTGRGLYELSDADVTEHHTLALVGKRIPNAVICLLSSLQFHDIGTQSPSKVWIAIDRKAAKPHADYPTIRIVRFTGSSLSEGIEMHDIEGVTVRIYNPAKTVADCFKYRNKIGLDVSLEALRECIRGRRCTHDELWHYAKVCRVANVMRPYLEAVA